MQMDADFGGPSQRPQYEQSNSQPAGPSQSQPEQSQNPLTQEEACSSGDEAAAAAQGVALNKSEKFLQSENVDPQEVTMWIKRTIRLALFSERRKIPLKREEIIQKALSGKSLAFHGVVKRANEHLRRTFGLELVELPTRQKKNAPIGQRQKNVAREKGGSRSYILRSVIDPEKRVDLINWDGEANSRALLLILLSLIFVNSGVVEEDKLGAYLHQLRIEPDRELPEFSTARGDASVSQLITHWTKLGYIDKIKVPEAERDTFEYIWGPRARVEVSENDLATFIVEVHDVDDEAKKAKLRRDILRK